LRRPIDALVRQHCIERPTQTAAGGHQDQAVAEANQVLFFNAAEGYRISHPVPGGDASLSLAISEALLHELAPSALLHEGAMLAFRRQRLRMDLSRCSRFP
jgi:hypothetical protein